MTPKEIKAPWIMVLLIIVIVATGAISFRNDEKLSQAQAIHLAENFIRSNGYTALPANKSLIKYELFDREEKNLAAILALRHNTLHPKAFCVVEDSDKWNVGFLSAEVNFAKLSPMQRQRDLPGRAVIVSKAGRDISIAHKDPAFSNFRKL